MTARHRRSRHWRIRITGTLAVLLAVFGAGHLHGSPIGHADGIATCTATETP